MKLNKTNKTTFTAASLLRLHDAMQNLQLMFCTCNSTWSGRFSQTCKEAAFSLPSCRTWGRLQLYLLPGALQRREGTIKPALGLGQNKATPDSGHPPPQLCNIQSDCLFTQKLWAWSRSQIRHVQLLPQTPLPLRQSAVGLSQHGLWFPVNTHTATPQHLWDTSRSEED